MRWSPSQMAPLSGSKRNSRRKSLSGGYLMFGGTLSPARPLGHFSRHYVALTPIGTAQRGIHSQTLRPSFLDIFKLADKYSFKPPPSLKNCSFDEMRWIPLF
jgi:hypothetical protein